ncbi:MAG: hypothetical protein HZA17_06280, partial [Nitrospirae bacterium]|nr:hypothetical protein [Nitrospirota bacterium]
MKKIFFLIFAGLCALTGYSHAGPCSATLVSGPGGLSVRLPAISVGSESYSADLTYVPADDGRYRFTVENLQAGLPSCGLSAATIFGDGPNIDVLVPDLDLNSVSYWIKFVYSPSTDGRIWLSLLNFGQNFPKGDIAGTTVYHATTAERKYSYYHYIPASALRRNPVRVLLYTHGSGKIDT